MLLLKKKREKRCGEHEEVGPLIPDDTFSGIIWLPLWPVSRWCWKNERGKKWGQADYRAHPPRISSTVPRSMSSSLCVPVLMASAGRRARAFWPNRCDLTSLLPSVTSTASVGQQANGASCGLRSTLGVFIAVMLLWASVLLESGHPSAPTVIRIRGN